MSSRLIKNYSNWLAEATAQPGQPTARPVATEEVNGIALIAASASSSNVKDATKFGFKTDTVYTITVPSLGTLRLLADDGNRFGGPNTKTAENPSGRVQINLDSTEKTAKPGDDLLEIAGKRIYETGDLLLKKTELTSPVTIKASNNGMLVLLRFAGALADMKTRFEFYLGNCKNYAVKFALGREISGPDARGYAYYWTRPGALGGISSSIAASVSIAALELLGLGSSIADSDEVFNSYHGWVRGKDSATSSTEIAGKIAKFITANRTLVNDPMPNTAGALAKITKADLQKLVTRDTKTNKYSLTQEGQRVLTDAATAIATAVTPSKPPAEFAGVADVFAEYSKIVRDSLLTKTNPTSIANWFSTVQGVQSWKTGAQAPGSTGTGGAKQGEGEVG